MELTLQDKVAIVTGGRQGLGRVMCETFLNEGASVVTCARDGAGLAAVVQEWQKTHGERITGMQADVSRLDEIERLVAAATDSYGGVDLLVNNAATSASGTTATLTEEQWRLEIDVKLMSMVRTARLCAPIMKSRGGGSIININAIFARQPDMTFYASSVARAGSLSLTKLLAKEFAADGIRANAIGLGLIATDAWKAWYDPSTGSYEEYLKGHAKEYGVPMGRLGDPQEVANLVLFLCSGAAPYISGTQIDIDGALAAYL